MPDGKWMQGEDVVDPIYKTHRRRATLTEAGHRILVDFLGVLTDLWNAGLEERQDAYRKTGKSPSFHDQCKSITEIRKQNPEVGAFNAYALRFPLNRLHKAFQRFFEGTSRYPRFKGKRRGIRSFDVSGTQYRIRKHGKRGRGWVLLIKGLRPMRFEDLPDGEIQQVRVVKKAIRVEIHFLVKEQVEIAPSASPIVGIDRGITHQVAASDGFTVPKQTRERGAIKVWQRKMAKRKNGSRGYKHARKMAAKAHQREAERLHGLMHEISRGLIKRYGPNFALEDLKVLNMMKNRSLARAIADSLWGKIARMLEYRCKWDGGEVYFVNPRNTSKTCSSCGEVKARILLSERVFECEVCGFVLHRDVNASRNIEIRGAALAAALFEERGGTAPVALSMRGGKPAAMADGAEVGDTFPAEMIKCPRCGCGDPITHVEWTKATSCYPLWFWKECMEPREPDTSS